METQLILKVESSSRVPRNFTGVVELSDGWKLWLKDGKYHREDGPAVEYPNGTKYWWTEGNLHRLNGPAIEYSNGSKEWFLFGREMVEEDHAKFMKGIRSILPSNPGLTIKAVFDMVSR